MNYEIKRFDLLAVFKVCFLVYLIVGFLIGLLYGLVLMKMLSTLGPLLDTPALDDVGDVGFLGAMIVAVFVSFFLAVVWSILTVIAAGVYNVIAGMAGGIKLELAQVMQLYPPQPQAQTMPQPPPPSAPPQGGMPGA